MSDRANAGNLVGGLAVGGIVAIGLGTFMAAVEWPHESVYNGDDTGSAVLAYLGLVIAGLGQLSVFAAVVAWAVTVGIRWSGLREDIDYSIRRATMLPAEASTGAGPGTRRRTGDLSSIKPLGPVADESHLDEDGR